MSVELMDEWLTKEEASQYLRVTKRTVNRYMHEGLRFKRLHGQWGPVRFRKNDLDAFMGEDQEYNPCSTEQADPGGVRKPDKK